MGKVFCKAENTTDQDSDECVICKQSYINRSEVLPCRHQFCYGCIRKWSNINNTCPLCKGHIHEIKKMIDSSEIGDREEDGSDSSSNRSFPERNNTESYVAEPESADSSSEEEAQPTPSTSSGVRSTGNAGWIRIMNFKVNNTVVDSDTSSEASVAASESSDSSCDRVGEQESESTPSTSDGVRSSVHAEWTRIVNIIIKNNVVDSDTSSEASVAAPSDPSCDGIGEQQSEQTPSTSDGVRSNESTGWTPFTNVNINSPTFSIFSDDESDSDQSVVSERRGRKRLISQRALNEYAKRKKVTAFIDLTESSD